MAKILVTDGAGFIGSHAVDLFLERELDKTLAYFRKAEQAV